MIELDQRLKGCMYGLLIGDALGVPYEFKDADRIPQYDLIEMTVPKGYKRTWDHIADGTWSDDGAQALILLETMMQDDDQFNQTAFVGKLIDWKDLGYWAVDNFRFDIGNQTNHALTSIQRGIADPQLHSEFSNGNGSLMRTAPAGLYYKELDKVCAVAGVQSMPTHGHALAVVTCRLYAAIIFNIVHGLDKDKSFDLAVTYLVNNVDGPEKVYLDKLLGSENNEPNGSGYVLDSFWSAIKAFWNSGSYEKTVRTAIQYGNDTDTTACIAGGLAGAYYGFDNIPDRWVKALRDREKADVLINQLIAKRV